MAAALMASMRAGDVGAGTAATSPLAKPATADLNFSGAERLVHPIGRTRLELHFTSKIPQLLGQARRPMESRANTLGRAVNAILTNYQQASALQDSQIARRVGKVASIR